MAIKTLDEYLETIPNDDNRARMVEVLDWVAQHYPELELRIAWNQPMFTHHGTYIIGFSAASMHVAMAPERATMIRFEPVSVSAARTSARCSPASPGTSPSTTNSSTPHSAPTRGKARHHVLLAPQGTRTRSRRGRRIRRNAAHRPRAHGRR